MTERENESNLALTPLPKIPSLALAIFASALVAGCVFQPPGPMPVPEPYDLLAVSGYVDSPSDYNASEHFSYSLRGRSAVVSGVVLKPTPCDEVKATAVRYLQSARVAVRLEFSDRGEPCAEVVTPSAFVLSVEGMAHGDQLFVTAGTRPLELDASGQLCGGIAAFGCPIGWECKLDGDYPDAGGNCVKEKAA